MRESGNQSRRRRVHLSLAAAGFAALVAVGSAGSAAAAQGSIDHVESAPGGQVKVLFSMPGAKPGVQPDLSSLQVTLNGKPVKATAALAADAHQSVRRTAILAFDVSESMQANHKFDEAKQAARVFLQSAPANLYVGIVTFAGTVQVAEPPTLDRAASQSVIKGLKLSTGTRLYDGVRQAITSSGTTGQRSVLVLSDGRDTSKTPISSITTALKKTDVKVDVVALAQSAADEALLQKISDAGHGSVFKANDPAHLSTVFAAEAQTLAKQLLVTATPAKGGSSEGSLGVSVGAGGATYSDSAFVTLSAPKVAEHSPAPAPTTLHAAPQSGFQISRNQMLGGLGAAFAGVLLLLLGALGVLNRKRPDSLETRIAAHTPQGARRHRPHKQEVPQGVTAQAVGVAQKALDNNANLESALGGRLEAAGMAIKPAEWLLAHAGIAFLLALVALLLSSGNIIFCAAGLVVGAIGPWIFLAFKKSRRVKAFKAQLADTLQLMSGSLSAGLSLAQSVDTVVREGAEPMAGEFRRALVEARLGVEIENALESVGERMQSKDFHWVVMAIRIQREVGGNLAELLNNVSNTIREREYLERQVLSLSAEGRLSVWILGGLPPGFMAYLLMANPSYLQPLFHNPVGWGMLGAMAVMLTVGILWMKKLVKVDV